MEFFVRPTFTAALLLGLSVSSAAAQSVWDIAEGKIERLVPDAFPQLPDDVRATLEHEGCRVPQAWGEDEPHNVVNGSFAVTGQTDWAVLCSVNGRSSILVFWGGAATCPSPLAASLPDRSFLQQTGVDGILFSRGIAAITLRERYWPIDESLPDGPTHDAITDAFYEKGATAYYCKDGTWLTFATN